MPENTYVRVSSVARNWEIPSKYIVQVLNNVESNKPHSASSRLELNTPLFMDTLHERAILALLDSESILSRMRG